VYFFLSDDLVIHTNTFDTFVGVISKIGGLFSALFGTFMYFCKKINDQWLIDKAVRSLYRVRSKEIMAPSKKDSKAKLQRTVSGEIIATWDSMNISVKEKVLTILSKINCLKNKVSLTSNMIKYQRGLRKAEQDLDIV
jgi:hypothetical protein